MQPTVTDNPGQGRYEIRDEQGRLAGYLSYQLRDGTAAFIHTEIEPGFEGKGLGSTLVRHALDDVRRRELAVAPFCPFVRSFIDRHRGYLDLVPERERERFKLA
jgi:predicted GNAT family acetyltransferase